MPLVAAFPPTYKFDKGRSPPPAGRRRRRRRRRRNPTSPFYSPADLPYDTSAKRRTPSYTDRILYKPGGRGSGVSCLCYDWVRAEGPSDHRPVVASFRVEDAGEGGETGEEITK